ncbi:MAG: Hsp20/alpha crystallin family protein [Gammaproteobacteria bacterium]|nr:Hsp20/alpha crystallin family protein [Gammaproteobacteria bacterium]
MNLVRFEPWSISDLMQHDFNRLNQRRLTRNEAATPAVDWIPAVDVVEEKQRFVLRADLPGVAATDIDVSMEDGVLTVAGQRSAYALDDDTAGIRRFERACGRFHRRFALPETADADGIAARSADGILEITIPKLAEVQPRRITVEAA